MSLRRSLVWIAVPLLWACPGGAPTDETIRIRPTVQGVIWEGKADPAVSRRMKNLYEADGTDRSNPSISLSVLKSNSESRRTETLTYLRTGKIADPIDFYRAAVIFSRATSEEHLDLGVRLARRAWERGIAEAWTIYQQVGNRWLETQGKKPRIEEGRLHAWPNLDDLNRLLWRSKDDGTYNVPLKLPPSLELKRSELEKTILAAQIREPGMQESFLDRVAVFESKSDLDRVVNQLRETASTDPVDRFLAAFLEHRALVALSPEAAAKLHPAFVGDRGWEKLLTMAIARQLHRRLAGSEEAMGPTWFREGFAAVMAGLPMIGLPSPLNDRDMYRKQDLQAIVSGRAPLDPQACALLFRHLRGATPIQEVLQLPKRGPIKVNLDELK